MIHELPRDVVELVLMSLDSRSIATWGCSCSAACTMVRKGREDALTMLRQGQCSKHWMFEIMQQERRDACIQVSASSSSRTDHGGSYWVDVDTHCPELLDRCIKRVVDHLPELIIITCGDGIFNRALTDAHLEHVRLVPFVAIPGNVGITDAGLEHLANARVLWLGGCTGICGSNLPELVYKNGSLGHMLSIKWIGGWGSHPPFHAKAIRRWLAMQEVRGLIVSQW
jgi:hypothetical protein